MTEVDFQTFAKRLFVQFPSLYEWLQRSSPDPVETQRLWRRTLANYSLADCLSVLDFWSESGQVPFAAYERDQVPQIIRSVIAKRHDAAAKKREQEAEASRRFDRGRNRDEGFKISFGGDTGCLSAFYELDPIYKAWKADKIDEYEYRERETEILERHIDLKPKREISGKYQEVSNAAAK